MFAFKELTTLFHRRRNKESREVKRLLELDNEEAVGQKPKLSLGLNIKHAVPPTTRFS